MIIRRNSTLLSSTFSSCMLIMLIFSQTLDVAYTRSVHHRRERALRVVREVYPEEVTSKQAKVCIFGDVVYGAGEAVGSSDPCEQCECHPPGVKCNPVQCPPPSPGCRALHRPDKCCPSYQCECVIGNRTYANGERLEENPNGPCKVCYCRGGEIQCTDVGCYTRDDCEPVHVPGQCCPKYENCPPRDHTPSSTEPPSIESFEVNNSWPTNNSDEPTSFEVGSGPQITSFEEVFPSSDRTPLYSGSAENKQSSEVLVDKDMVSSIENQSIKELPAEESQSKFTIKEVLPPPKREINYGTNANSDEFPKSKESLEKHSSENLSNESTIDRKDVFAETTEQDNNAYDHPPSVIKIDNKLIIYAKGEIKPGYDLSSTPASVITVSGAEGLEIGGYNFDLTSTQHPDENKSLFDLLSSEKYTSTDNGVDLKTAKDNHFNSDEILIENERTLASPTSFQPTSVKKQLSDRLIHDQQQMELEGPTKFPFTIEDNGGETVEIINDSLGDITGSNNVIVSNENDDNGDDNPLNVIPLDKINKDDTDNTENPAYPPLPDEIMVNREEDAEVLRNQDISVFQSVVENEMKSNNILINSKAALPPELINSPVENEFFEEGVENSSTPFNEISSTTVNSLDSKILQSPEILEILNQFRNETDQNRHEPAIVLPTDWLKDNATTPQRDDTKVIISADTVTAESLENATSTIALDASKEITSTKNPFLIESYEVVSTENSLSSSKSKETMEIVEESGEQVTEKKNLEILSSSNEDASVHKVPDSSLPVNADVEMIVTEDSLKMDENNAKEQESKEQYQIQSNESSAADIKDIEIIESSSSRSTLAMAIKSQESLENKENVKEISTTAIPNSYEEVTISNENASSETSSSRTSQELLNKVSDEIAKFRSHESTQSLNSDVLNILKDLLDNQKVISK